jgi:hypothetical protein
MALNRQFRALKLLNGSEMPLSHHRPGFAHVEFLVEMLIMAAPCVLAARKRT